MGELDRIYTMTGFDVTFIPMPPTMSATNVIDFTKDSATSANGAPFPEPKGIAPTDWLNRQPMATLPQVAEIFPQSFDDIVDEWAGSIADSRPAMIMELGIALAGTAAHELGHTFGLSHWDSYGLPSVGPAGFGAMMGEYIIFDTMGFQNGSIMATGKTGISELEREMMRDLSRYSKAKLEIATDSSVTPEPLTMMPFSHTDEVATPHTTMMDAQPLVGTSLPISGLSVVNVHAASLGDLMGTGTDTDYYEFTTEGPMKGLVTVEVLSTEVYADAVETTLKILDDMGMELFASDDFSFGGGAGTPPPPNMIFSTLAPIDGITDGDEDDPLVMNMELDPGTYFVEVKIDPDGTHSADPMSATLFYDLLITSETALVPEPSTGVLVLLACCCAFSLVPGRRAR